MAKRNLVITFGGGVNEVMREMIAASGLKVPRAPRYERLLMSDLQAGIDEIVYQNPYPDELAMSMLEEAGMKLRVFDL